MKLNLLIIWFLIILVQADAVAQKQLVVVRRQKVIFRLYPGDEIVLRTKGSKRVKRTYVNNIFNYAVLTHRDTVPFNEIDRIYFKQNSRINVIGGMLVFGGATFLIMDQVNNSLLQGNEFTFDKKFTASMLGLIAVGLPMMLIKKKSHRIGYKNRMMMVTKGSAFYRPDSRGYISPYLEN